MPEQKYFVEADPKKQSHKGDWTPIRGLELELSRSTDRDTAIVILAVPCPYAEGGDFPGTDFRITANGEQMAVGGFTYPMKQPQSFSRSPVTVVACVPLPKDQTVRVEAEWASIRGSENRIDELGTTSLSACLV